MFDPLRYRKERWFDDDRAEQIAEAPINDDAAEGGPSEKQNGKKSKVKNQLCWYYSCRALMLMLFIVL